MAMDVISSTQGAYQSVKASQSSVPAAEGAPQAHRSAAHVMQHSAAEKSISPVQPDTADGQLPSDKEIQAAIEVANKQARYRQTNAQFAYHEDSKRISIKIVDNTTNEVIKEIPSEETLEMISRLWDLVGMVVDERR